MRRKRSQWRGGDNDGAVRAGRVGTGGAWATLPRSNAVGVLEMGKADILPAWSRLRRGYQLFLLDAGWFPLPSLSPLNTMTVVVTRDDTTDRLPGGADQVVVTQACRAPVGLNMKM